MANQMHPWVALATLTWLLGSLAINEVAARNTSDFGPAVDAFCLAENGQTPYQDQGCALCHDTNLNQEVLPQWDWWRTGEFGNFCPLVVNNPPNGTIIAPATDQIISAGDSLLFQGDGNDPDGDTALRYRWDFSGAAPPSNLQNPGEIRFPSAGDYTVSLSVTDSHGLADPTPAQRRITVLALQVCTDADGDGFSLEGLSCGLQDCDDQDNAIHPDALELCDDGIDNNCNGLVDSHDPQATDCSVMSVCEDWDGDGFSPTGDFCGPPDCDDLDYARNPGRHEICGDGWDNDCDDRIDLADPECNGGDCLRALFETRYLLHIERAR
ncbi:MAG: MopE-related protein, partial [Chromatiales bacterium]